MYVIILSSMDAMRMAHMSRAIILNEDFGHFFEAGKDVDENDKDIIVFTFYPKKKEFLHYHIEISPEKLLELYRMIKEVVEAK